MITLEKIARAMRALARLPKPKGLFWVVNQETYQQLTDSIDRAPEGTYKFIPGIRTFVKPDQIERVREFKSEAEAIAYMNQE